MSGSGAERHKPVRPVDARAAVPRAARALPWAVRTHGARQPSALDNHATLARAAQLEALAMRTTTRTSSLLLATLALAACGVGDPSEMTASQRARITSDDGIYVSLRRDLAACATCGGFWLTTLNQRDVGEQYALDLDFSQSNLERATVLAIPIEELILKGNFGPAHPASRTRAFVVAAAFEGSGVAKDEASGEYVTIREDLRDCAFPTCGGFFTRGVNEITPEVYVNGLVWSQSNLTDAQIQALQKAGVTNLLLRGIAGPEEPQFHTHPLVVFEPYRPVDAAPACVD
jgi:hypothetical protein